MNSDNDLLHQPGTVQQHPALIKNKNHSWKAFFILLIIFNLLYIAAFFIFSPFILMMLVFCPLLIPLAVMDNIAVSSYRKKRFPPWKVFFIPLVVVNVIFFSLASWGLSQSGGGVAAPVITLIALTLLIIDSLAILSYIHIHLTHRKAKVILYTVLASVIFGLIVSGIFVLGFILSTHS